MRTSFGPLLGLALVFSATPVLAQEEESKAVTVTGGVTVVSDYRYRGISQTNKDPAIQGSFTVAHKSGVYATVWGSSIDDYVAAGADQEIDLSLGYKKTFGGTTLDVGALYYYYPGAEQIIPDYKSDFLEIYGSVAQAVGPATVKAAIAYAPKQGALAFVAARPKEDNFYANLSIAATVPDTGIGVSAAVGRSFTKSFLTGGVKYTDWSLGATYTTGPVTLGVSYVDTNKSILSPTKNVSKGGIVGSIGVAF